MRVDGPDEWLRILEAREGALAMMKLVHVMSHMDEEAAGPTQSVSRLCEALVACGQATDLHTMAISRVPAGVGVAVHEQWRLLGQFGFSLELIRSLASVSRSCDILHNHSLWSFPSMATGLVTGRASAKLVTSPRGTLAPAALARSRTKKFIFKPLQWLALTRAALLHATSEMEHADIRNNGLFNPVAIIPNGIDVPDIGRGERDGRSTQMPRRLLFLGRLHPIKGIELLLQAWRELQDEHRDWELVVAGKGDDTYVASLKALAARLGSKRVQFTGPVYGEAKKRVYLSSHLFVLPTATENFGMAIAEAQAHGVPVVTTKGAPWSGLISHESGWWVDQTLDDIRGALDEAMCLDYPSLEKMGLRGSQWMASDFEWSSVARQMISVYRWLIDGGEVPGCVRLD